MDPDRRIEAPPASVMAVLAAQEAGASVWAPPAHPRATLPPAFFEDIGDTLPDGVPPHQIEAPAPLTIAGFLVEGGPARLRECMAPDTTPDPPVGARRRDLVVGVASVVAACVLLCLVAVARLALGGH